MSNAAAAGFAGTGYVDVGGRRVDDEEEEEDEDEDDEDCCFTDSDAAPPLAEAAEESPDAELALIGGEVMIKESARAPEPRPPKEGADGEAEIKEAGVEACSGRNDSQNPGEFAD